MRNQTLGEPAKRANGCQQFNVPEVCKIYRAKTAKGSRMPSGTVLSLESWVLSRGMKKKKMKALQARISPGMRPKIQRSTYG